MKTSITLNNYEGTIDALLQIVLQEEIDIHEISLQSITGQYCIAFEQKHPSIESGAEFIANVASLVWFKSKKLLPRQKEEELEESIVFEEPSSSLEQIEEYRQFKEVAKGLASLASQQRSFYSRGIDSYVEQKRPLGIDHLTIDDLALLFREIAKKNQERVGIIEEETWKVTDAIENLYATLRSLPDQKIDFLELFHFEKSRLELIVMFLGILELMKSGKLIVFKEANEGTIWIQLL